MLLIVLRFVSLTSLPLTVTARDEEPQRKDDPGRDIPGRRWRDEGVGGRVINVTGFEVPGQV